MNGALTGILLLLLWGTVVIRLPTLWRDAQQRAMWATVFTLALLKTIATPGVNGLLDGIISQPQVLPHLLGVAAAFFLLRFLSLITAYDSARPRAARYQLLLAAAVLATLLFLIAITPEEIKTKGSELLGTALAPSTTAYWVVLNGYLGTVAVIATRLFWRVRRSAPPGLLRQGLHAIAVGIFLVALYAILKTGLILLHAFGVTLTVDRVEPVANAIRAIGTILSVVGAAVPAAGKMRTVVRAYRSFWALAPLWRTMRRTFPEVILFSRRRALVELAGVEDVQLRLYRRVIEIRDGLLVLRDCLPSDTFDQARAYLGDRATPALVEACGIAVALDRYQAVVAAGHELGEGNRPFSTKPVGSAQPLTTKPAGSAPILSTRLAEEGAPSITETGGDRGWTDAGGELSDEVAWLSEVSTAYRRKEPGAFARLQTVSDPV